MAEESGPWAEMRQKDEQIARCNLKAQSSSNKQRLGGLFLSVLPTTLTLQCDCKRLTLALLCTMCALPSTLIRHAKLRANQAQTAAAAQEPQATSRDISASLRLKVTPALEPLALSTHTHSHTESTPHLANTSLIYNQT